MSASVPKNSSRVIFDGVRVPRNAALFLDELLEAVLVEPLRVVEIPGVVADRDQRNAQLPEENSQVRPDVAVPLDDELLALQIEVVPVRPFADAVN